MAIELLQGPDIVQNQRWFRLPQAAKYLRDQCVDVPGRAFIQKAVSHCSFKNFTYSSKAACSSGLTSSTGSERAANLTLACCRPKSLILRRPANAINFFAGNLRNSASW